MSFNTAFPGGFAPKPQQNHCLGALPPNPQGYLNNKDGTGMSDD
jgi:hypothetical protein